MTLKREPGRTFSEGKVQPHLWRKGEGSYLRHTTVTYLGKDGKRIAGKQRQ